MALVFFGAWFAQSVTGMTEFNQEQAAHGEATVSWLVRRASRSELPGVRDRRFSARARNRGFHA